MANGGLGWARRLGAALAAVMAASAIAAGPADASLDIVAWDGSVLAGAGGELFSQASGHPGEIVTTVVVKNHPEPGFFGDSPVPDETVKDLFADLPAGLVGNPTATPSCTAVDLTSTQSQEGGNRCPIDSQVGMAVVWLGEFPFFSPVYNMVPSAGDPARFAFKVSNIPVSLTPNIRQGPPFHLGMDTSGILQLVPLYRVDIGFWGTPADPSHDDSRCSRPQPVVESLEQLQQLQPSSPSCLGNEALDQPHAAQVPATAFLRLPTTCTGPGVGLRFDIAGDSWSNPGIFDSASFFTHEAAPNTSQQRGTDGCDRIDFNPSMQAQPTVESVESPSGLAVAIDTPSDGLLNPNGVADSDVKKVRVALPEGITLNPAQAEGLAVCTPAQYAEERVDAEPLEGCPQASKVGTVSLETPLLDEPVRGDVYIAQQDDPATTQHGAENPFDSLLAVYVVLKSDERGVIVKLPGRVETHERTGQIVTTFDDLPQVPFSHFVFRLREGARSPIVTPPACGTYATEAQFTPWSDPSKVVESTSSFHITSGIGGGPCPSGGLPPFKPGLIAGSINNVAGGYSPFNVRLFRTDEEQEITHFSIKLPPGIVGKLAGVPFCPDASLAAAKNRTGQEEIDTPSCPPASEVGRTLVGAGVGSVLTYAPGKVYLAGPYNGNPLSIAAITAAKVGPFDLGTVVVREALDVNPETGEVFIDSTGSDPIPHIIDGVTTHIRDIRVYVDRPEFTLNPTSCDPTSTASTVLGSGLDFFSEADDQPVTVSTRYQAADCAALGFKPRLSLKLKGGTKRGGHPALKAVLRMRGTGESNIARAQVTLPRSEFLDQSHLDNVCTRVQFNSGQGNGTNCPPASVYGKARANTPILDEALEGPVFLRSSEHKLPDLVAALHSGKIEIHLVGRIDSVRGGQIRTTFESVPDAPVTRFVLEMGGGRKSLLENSANLCRGTHRALASFDAHNGKIRDFSPVLKPDCGGKARKKHKRKR